jgi:hypothetical protein
MLQQLKASAPEAAPQYFLAALKTLYEEAVGEEEAGEEEVTGEALQRLAAVSHRIASLYSGGCTCSRILLYFARLWFCDSIWQRRYAAMRYSIASKRVLGMWAGLGGGG